MQIKASNLRKDIYRLLDSVIESGEPLEIERNGSFLKVIPEFRKGSKLRRLVKHTCIVGDPEELVHLDWADSWSPGEL
jgi:hypothetical protein